MDDPPARPAPRRFPSESEGERALARYRLLQPYLEGQTSLTAVSQGQAVTLRTLQRWASRYQAEGLAGLARKRRTDRGQRTFGQNGS